MKPKTNILTITNDIVIKCDTCNNLFKQGIIVCPEVCGAICLDCVKDKYNTYKRLLSYFGDYNEKI